jgi:S-ribosylhomocysteine lyase LuxS involved in autoinducer biosynthesis
MRKSISVTFFSMVATLLVLGTAVLGCCSGFYLSIVNKKDL